MQKQAGLRRRRQVLRINGDVVTREVDLAIERPGVIPARGVNRRARKKSADDPSTMPHVYVLPAPTDTMYSGAVADGGMLPRDRKIAPWPGFGRTDLGLDPPRLFLDRI